MMDKHVSFVFARQRMREEILYRLENTKDFRPVNWR